MTCSCRLMVRHGWVRLASACCATAWRGRLDILAAADQDGASRGVWRPWIADATCFALEWKDLPPV